MFSITLIRHGPPAVSLRQKVSGHQFRAFVERYDAARILRRSLPPLVAAQIVEAADVVFASSRPRAVHTAELLGATALTRIDPQFREIEFPVDFPQYFRFSALMWSALALGLWRLGYTSRSESLVQSKARAKTATDLLEQQLPDVEQQLPDVRSVVLVAHGGINRLIAKELRRRGWRGPRLPHSQHWGCTTYCR